MSNARSNVTKLTSLINVKAFGAKGDGTTGMASTSAVPPWLRQIWLPSFGGRKPGGSTGLARR